MLPNIKKSKKLIYLDHAATTPVDPRVKAAMEPFWNEYFGNPSSLYGKGREADFAIKNARSIIAGLIGAKPDDIIFTAGGTESINLAIFGVARYFKPTPEKPAHLITSAIEHHAVLHSYEALEREGYQTSYIDVDERGLIKLDDLKKVVRPETIFISVMYANNEIGTVEPIAEMGKWLKQINTDRLQHGLTRIIFHIDACQAAGALDVNVQHLGVDLMTVNGSKMYGPKQVGFLYVKTGTKLKPLIYGGGQERNFRSGTENVAGIVGLAEAFKLAQEDRLKENARLRKLRDYFIDQLFEKIPKIVLNGPDERLSSSGVMLSGSEASQSGKRDSSSDALLRMTPSGRPNERGSSVTDENVKRLPNNINISILDIEGEALLLYLDAYNICMSTGSACTSTSLDPSHVILAIGRPYEYAHGSMRFTLGKSTTKKDIDYVMKVMPGIVEELRRISPVKLDPEHPEQITMEKAFIGENMQKFRNDKIK